MVRDLRRLADERFDLLVVGAGIYGALIAWDASLRGLSVALIDRGDFGSGASANSLKTLHGGLRSLQALDLRQMRLFIRERRALARVAPHLVRVLPCVIPTYADRRRGRALMQGALAINDLVAEDRDVGVQDPALRLPRSRLIGRDECLHASPYIDPAGVTGGAVWHDYQMRNSDRLTFAFVQSAASRGAACANYLGAQHLLLQDGDVHGVVAVDSLSGDSFDLRARVVANTTGVAPSWLDDVLGPFSSRPLLSRATNLVVSTPATEHAAGGLANSRFLFMVPWHAGSIVGTSHDVPSGLASVPDARHSRGGDPSGPPAPSRSQDPGGAWRASWAELGRFLAEVQQAFPRAAVDRSTIRLVQQGVLPMRAQTTKGVQLLRESAIVDHAEHGASGLLSVFGVRYTTARHTAARAVDAIFRTLGTSLPPVCRTDVSPVVGGDLASRAEEVHSFRSQAQNLLEDADLDRFVTSYGTRARAPLALLSAQPELRKPLATTCPTTGAEVLYAIREESAVTLGDVLLRRTEAGSTGHPGADAVRSAGALMQPELGWDDARLARELAAVDAELALPT